MSSLLVAFGVIFVAELGDKSQLLTLAFASRHRVAVVLGGLVLAEGVLTLLAVTVGAVVADALDPRVLTTASGVAFLGFAAWTLREDDDADELAEEVDEAEQRAGRWGALGAVTAAYAVAELGDKTQLAAVTLATRHPAAWVWLGAVTGILAANVLAVVVGRLAHRRLPAHVLRYGAAGLFALFGVLLVIEGIRG